MKDTKSNLRNIRVLKKNMIFLQSYDNEIPHKTLADVGTYEVCGRVESVKTKQNYKNITAYVTFEEVQAAALAFLACYYLGDNVKVLFGTVQYCKYFMRKAECRNDYCVFMHVRDRKNQITINDEISDNVYQEHLAMAHEISQANHYQALKNILNSHSQQPEHSLFRQGLSNMAFKLKIDLGDPLPPAIDNKQSTLKTQLTERGSSTQGSQRQQSQQMQLNGIVVNKKDDQSSSFNMEQYINIRLIKKIIRQKQSKIYNQQSIKDSSRRERLILYGVVKTQRKA